MQYLSPKYAQKVDDDNYKTGFVINKTISIMGQENEKLRHFFKVNRFTLIMALFNGAIKLQIYDAAYEISYYFMDVLLEADYFSCFDTFFEQFKSTDRYNLKASLLH